MKYTYIIILLFLAKLGFSQSTFSAYSDNIPGAPAGSIDVELKLAFDAPDGLGSSNLAIQVDPTVLGVPVLQSSPVLGNTNYAQTNFIANNGSGQYTVNFALNVANAGVPVGVTPTSVAVLRFPVLNSAALPTSFVDFLTDPDQLVVFLDNNMTLLNIGPLFPSSLPIKIKRFVAEKDLNARATILDWTSVSEVNSSHFEIERSLDGFNFEYIGSVKASENSSLQIEYTFKDSELPFTRGNENIFYYRLKMVDLDGKYEYTDVRSVSFDDLTKVELSIYPNPTANSVFVKMNSPFEKEEAPLSIYDASGRLVLAKNVSTNGISQIELTNLPNAIYNIQITHQGKVYNNQVVKTN
ncbi:MAG: hypothetical protein RLZZ546_1272 [Bacteroidota bacterium]|jgi:hypothetical protein